MAAVFPDGVRPVRHSSLRDVCPLRGAAALSGALLGDDSDLAEAIKLTDYLFREGFIHGFDVFTDYENRKIFASHYMRAFDESKVRAAAEKYAEENGCILTTFTDAETLGREMRLVA